MKYEYARQHYSGEKDKTSGRFVKKHGYNKERLYKVWVNIKYRCFNKKCKYYKNYGGRGIKICDEWDKDYMAFRKWAIENGYDPKEPKRRWSIDRIDSNGNYEPSNCRWADYITQNNNRTINHYVNYKGKTYTVAELAREKNIKYQLLLCRINKGWQIEEALTKPVHKRSKRGDNNG